VRKADNLPTSCAVVTKSRNLNFLEPSGPVQACNGKSLTLPFSSLDHCVANKPYRIDTNNDNEMKYQTSSTFQERGLNDARIKRCDMTADDTISTQTCRWCQRLTSLLLA